MHIQRLTFNGTEVVLVDDELPEPASDEVQVRTEWTQVSIGTEVAGMAEAAKTGRAMALGYSNVGRVARVGADVQDMSVDDRVLSLAPHASRVNVKGTPARVVPVPDGLDADLATLGILGSVAYHIVERAAPRPLEPTAVVGQGVVGALILQIVRQCGVRPLLAVDVDLKRLERAQELGADHVVDASQPDAVNRARDLAGGEGVSLCIEAASSAKAYDTAISLLRLRGRLVVSSAVYEPVPFRIEHDLVHRELTIIGAHQPKCPVEPNPYYPWTQAGNRMAAIEDIRDGRLHVAHLISHRVSPAEAPGVYGELREQARDYTGVLIDWRGEDTG